MKRHVALGSAATVMLTVSAAWGQFGDPTVVIGLNSFENEGAANTIQVDRPRFFSLPSGYSPNQIVLAPNGTQPGETIFMPGQPPMQPWQNMTLAELEAAVVGTWQVQMRPSSSFDPSSIYEFTVAWPTAAFPLIGPEITSPADDAVVPAEFQVAFNRDAVPNDPRLTSRGGIRRSGAGIAGRTLVDFVGPGLIDVAFLPEPGSESLTFDIRISDTYNLTSDFIVSPLTLTSGPAIPGLNVRFEWRAFGLPVTVTATPEPTAAVALPLALLLFARRR